MLRDYYILINHKREIRYTDKSQDVMGKLPTDLTSAAPSDLDNEQLIWARDIGAMFSAWNKRSSLKSVRAYYVRWKTRAELEKESLDALEGKVPSLEDQLRQFPICSTKFQGANLTC